MTVPPSTLAVASHAVGLAPARRPRKARRWLRTRDKEHLHLLNLTLDVNTLQSEIHALRLARSLLCARALNRRDDHDGSYVKMVHEYFRKTRHGYLAVEAQPMVAARSFLYAMLDADVVKGHLRGIDLCIKMIAMYTASFGPVTHELLAAGIAVNPNADADDRLNGHGSIMVRARTRYTTTIVVNTFAVIFPFAPAYLREKLIGQPLDGYGQFDIVFDTVTHRVLRFDMEFDFLPAFAKVLPRPADLAVLFSGALVAADCTIGDEAEPAKDRAPDSSEPVQSPTSVDAPPTPEVFRARAMDIRSLLNDDDEDDE